MQVLFEKKDGVRVPISEQAYKEMMLRYPKKLTHIIRQKGLTVVCMGKPRRYHEKPVRYGGGEFQRNPYDHINSKGMGLSSWAIDNDTKF